MGKYCSGMTIRGTFENERDEVKAILEKYNVSEEDTAAILGALAEPYFQWNKSSASGRAQERILTDMGMNISDYFRTYMDYFVEEEQKYPWTETEKIEEDEG